MPQGSPVFLEHTTCIDIAAIMQAGIKMEDYVFYHVRVRKLSMPFIAM
jgi:hypothetical protein